MNVNSRITDQYIDARTFVCLCSVYFIYIFQDGKSENQVEEMLAEIFEKVKKDINYQVKNKKKNKLNSR